MSLSKLQALSAIALLSVLIATGLSLQQYPEPRTQTRESNEKITPAEARRLLEEGNKRFIAGTLINTNSTLTLSPPRSDSSRTAPCPDLRSARSTP